MRYAHIAGLAGQMVTDAVVAGRNRVVYPGRRRSAAEPLDRIGAFRLMQPAKAPDGERYADTDNDRPKKKVHRASPVSK